MENSKRTSIIGTIILLAFIAVIVASCNKTNIDNTFVNNDSGRIYYCDYHTISFRTKITYTKDNDNYEITGNFITFLTDPLKLSKNGTVIGRADDSYNIITQDDHAIIINDKFEIDVAGNFEIFGNSYELYDADGNKVGSASFNTFCTDGSIKDIDGNIVAKYRKDIMLNDYNVTIYDNTLCSDEAILMIIASYVSDYHADDN